MKRVIGILALLVGMQYTFGQGIDFFHGTFEEAKIKAKEEGKLIFMDAYAVWCGPCKMMTNSVFPQKKVGDFFNANFINMKVDMEKGEGLALRSQFGVTAYPTLMLINANGEAVETIRGARNAESLIAWAKSAAVPNQAAVGKLQEKYDNGNRSQGLMKDLIKVKAAYNEDYDDLFAEFLSMLNEEDKISNENVTFIFDATSSIHSPGLQVLKDYEDYYVGVKGKEVYQKKYADIAKKNAKLAIKEKNETLIDEAVAFLKKHKPTDYKELSAKLYVDYYGAMKDWDRYDAAASKYLNKFKKGDDKAYRDVAWIYYMHIDDEGKIRKAEKWMQGIISSKNTYENNLTQAYLLYKLEAYSEAEDAVNYALILAGGQKKTDNAQILKDRILDKLNKKEISE